MAVALQGILDNTALEFGIAASNTKLNSNFITAVNRTLGELAIWSDKAVKFPVVTSVNQSVAIDATYEYILATGVAYYMMRLGTRPSDPKIAALAYQDTANRWLEAKADYVQDVNNIYQATTDSASVVALGYMDS